MSISVSTGPAAPDRIQPALAAIALVLALASPPAAAEPAAPRPVKSLAECVVILAARDNAALAEVTLRNALRLDAPLDFQSEDVLGASERAIAEEEALERAYERRPELRALGVGNVTELVDAQTARASADADRVRALYDPETAIAALERAIGEELATP